MNNNSQFVLLEKNTNGVAELIINRPEVHNAFDDEVQIEGSSSRIRFQFDGKAFRDRQHELIVVSRVEAGNRGTQGGGRDGGSR